MCTPSPKTVASPMNLLSDGFYISLIQWCIGSVLYVCVLIWMQEFGVVRIRRISIAQFIDA